MNKIKLSELVAARRNMTPGRYKRRGATLGGLATYVADCGLSSRPSQDAEGIVETHNAADVLIEIAQAALAWQRAGFASPLGYSSIAGEREALESALAKVEP